MALRQEGVRDVIALSDGTAVSCSGDRAARQWDSATGQLLRSFDCGDGGAWALADCGKLLAASSYTDGTILLFDPLAPSCVQRLIGHSSPVMSLAMAQSQQRLASGSYKEIKIWELRDGRGTIGWNSGFSPRSRTTPKKTISRFSACTCHGDWISSLASLPDGCWASAALDGTVKLWSRGGCALRSFRGHTDWVSAVVPMQIAQCECNYAPSTRVWQAEASSASSGCADGIMLATAGFDGRIYVLDAASGEACLEFANHGCEVLALAALPGGGIVSAAYDAVVREWDAGNGSLRRRLVGHKAAVNCLAVLPMRTGLVSGAADGTIKFWAV